MTTPMPPASVLAPLRRGVCIPALPLALNAQRKFDERRERALARYYLAAGSGGLAVAVHSTQFEIRLPQHGLLRPVLSLAIEELKRHEQKSGKTLVKVGGVVGQTKQAVAEAQQLIELGYDVGLLSLGAMAKASDDELIAHCREVSKHVPIVGFYLQPSVGGRILPASFWRRFAEIENVVAIKMAPFNRYQTIDVVRAVAEAGRALALHSKHAGGAGGLKTVESGGVAGGIALYTGNDDNIVCDLVGDWVFDVNGKRITQRIVGGLLGHWACWTKCAVELLEKCHWANTSTAAANAGINGGIPYDMMLLNRQVTDMNAAIFDPAHHFHGCIPGIHEVLRRQGLLEGTWCLNPDEQLSPGQADEITRVCRAYPHLVDDDFIAKHRDEWLR
ncbi:MAG: dihydrodipicolinate synthase family protein [Planctomycetes bacterium]|nr:dihydrodipicolinate synthase family protein [Planctomycetota bacterium]